MLKNKLFSTLAPQALEKTRLPKCPFGRPKFPENIGHWKTFKLYLRYLHWQPKKIFNFWYFESLKKMKKCYSNNFVLLSYSGILFVGVKKLHEALCTCPLHMPGPCTLCARSMHAPCTLLALFTEHARELRLPRNYIYRFLESVEDF